MPTTADASGMRSVSSESVGLTSISGDAESNVDDHLPTRRQSGWRRHMS
jgi:hypothetical protein